MRRLVRSFSRSARVAARALAASALVAFAAAAHAGERGAIVVWPTLSPAGDEAGGAPLHRPTSAEPVILARAQEVDATLRDAVQDLGFTLDVADAGPLPGKTRDVDLLARTARRPQEAIAGAAPGARPGTNSAGTWVLSARLEADGGDVLVRLVLASPENRELRVRVDRVKPDDLAVRVLVMLRGLVSSSEPGTGRADDAADASRCTPEPHPGTVLTTGLRSPGRAVLSVNGALFGAYAAYSVQRASGSDDPRVLYPLLALGTGIGLGTALLVSDEWDLSPGDAWFLSAGAWWGAASGVLLANGLRAGTLPDRYAWGIGSGFLGLGVAVFGLTQRRMDEGGALLTHSGGALGLFLGGLVDLGYRGTLDARPYAGAGFGAALGVTAAGTLAAFVPVSASRILLVDLGAGVGALASAAAASPLLLGSSSDGARSRIFLAATGGGTILGGALGLLLTRGAPSAPAAALPGAPMAGVIGASATREGAVPAYGIGWSGTF